MSLLLLREILGVFVVTLTADVRYPVRILRDFTTPKSNATI